MDQLELLFDQHNAAWLWKALGYLHLMAGVITAILVGTMGVMPGRAIAYPALSRYTQGAIAVLFLAAGYSWLVEPLYIVGTTGALVSAIIFQTGQMIWLSMSKLETPDQQMSFLRRLAPLFIPVLLIAVFEIGLSVQLGRMAKFERHLLKGQQEIKQDVKTAAGTSVENGQKLDSLLKDEKKNH